MSYEGQIATILQADSALTAVLTGGIYVWGDLSGEGITRDATPAAFDPTTGVLLPVALVKERGTVPTFEVSDTLRQVTSANLVVELWLYEQSRYAAIDAAKPLIYRLLQGARLADSFEMYLANTLARQRDSGALDGVSLERLDYALPLLLTA